MNKQSANRSRRAFLLGESPPAAATVPRPPWSRNEAFSGACTGCGACIPACPEGILALDPGRLPMVNFRQGSGACTFCGACADACPEPVFVPAQARATTPAWTLRAAVGDRCLTRTGVMCQSCKDACGDSAIRFDYGAGRVPQPTIDSARCTGCGACLAPCPTAAIEIRMDKAALTEATDA